MSSPALESFLARLYTSEALLERFVRDPPGAMAGAGLSPGEERSLGALDRASLLLTAHSFAHKRSSRGWRPGLRWRRRCADWAARLHMALWRALDGGPRPHWRAPHR